MFRLSLIDKELIKYFAVSKQYYCVYKYISKNLNKYTYEQPSLTLACHLDQSVIIQKTELVKDISSNVLEIVYDHISNIDTLLDQLVETNLYLEIIIKELFSERNRSLRFNPNAYDIVLIRNYNDPLIIFRNSISKNSSCTAIVSLNEARQFIVDELTTQVISDYRKSHLGQEKLFHN